MVVYFRMTAEGSADNYLCDFKINRRTKYEYSARCTHSSPKQSSDLKMNEIPINQLDQNLTSEDKTLTDANQ